MATLVYLPPSDDPRWKRWSKPVEEFLAEPRTWRQLLAWAVENDFNGVLLRNCLAWLESKNRAFATRTVPVVWFRGRYDSKARRKAELLSEETKQKRRAAILAGDTLEVFAGERGLVSSNPTKRYLSSRLGDKALEGEGDIDHDP